MSILTCVEKCGSIFTPEIGGSNVRNDRFNSCMVGKCPFQELVHTDAHIGWFSLKLPSAWHAPMYTLLAKNSLSRTLEVGPSPFFVRPSLGGFFGPALLSEGPVARFLLSENSASHKNGVLMCL
jgi:hypothetical protein